MNATPARHIPRFFGLRRPWLSRALAAGLVLALLLSGQAHRAAADTTPSTCVVNGLIISPCPVSATGTLPPDLLNTSQLSQGLYAATPDQLTSLQNLEQTAVSNTLHDHGLPASDATAAQSWGRDDAEAELFALLVQAIQTPPISRTTDQQNAVDWFSAVVQRDNVLAAQDAGLEYVKWSGLDQTQYQHLLSTNASESTLQSFFNVTPVNYNNPTNPGASTGGYCVYQPPAPYQTEYSDASNQSCVTPCTSTAGCIPTGPTYDQFVKWGAADANDALFNSIDFATTSRNIALGVGFGVAGAEAVGIAALLLGAGLTGVVSGSASASAFAAALFPYSVAAGAAGIVTAAAVASLVVIVIAAVAIGIVDGINVFNAAAVPGELASLIASAPTTTPDLGAMLAGTNQTTSLFGLFVGATLPSPLFESCDNSQLINQTSTSTITQTGIAAPCLNAPAIPAPANSDPAFAIQAKGSSTTTYSASLSWQDAVAQTTTTARLSGHWFIDQETSPDGATDVTQTLRMHYTDWSGQGQTAWLLGDPISGYKFLGTADQSASGAPIDPSTCLADQTCAYSSTIDYVGTDGHDYSASIIPSLAPTVAASASSVPVEGSAVTFTANGSSPLGLPITYQWQFEQPIPGVPGGVNYGAPVTGTQATVTWPTSGTFHVQLTATDSLGKQTVDVFAVAVADVPPTLALLPATPSGPLGCITFCDEHTVPLGTVTALHGTITHTGSADGETVDINWGDGTDDAKSIGSSTIYFSSLDLNAVSNTQISLADTHAYTMAGTYPVTVTVHDQAWATAVVTTTETVLPASTTTTLSSSANPAVSGQPITYTATISPTPDGGTVSFGGNDLVSFFCPSVPVDPATGTATCTGPLLNPGTTPVTATYSGDANFGPSSAAVLTQTVNKADTTVALTASANPVALGQSVTYTATVGVRAPGSGYPTGTVNFMDGATSLCNTVQTDPSTFTATCTTTYTAAGSHAITAAYSPAFGAEQLYNPSTSDVLTQTVLPASTTTTLSSSANPAPVGQPITYTATISPTPDSGTVSFGGNSLLTYSCPSMPINSATGTATCVLPKGMPLGQSPVTATYSGDANFGPSSAAVLTQTVTKADTAVALVASANPAPAGQSVTYTATVSTASYATPIGTVSFMDGANVLCATVPLDTNTETATCTTTYTAVGSHAITAAYSGNAGFNPSTSPVLTETVSKAATTLALTASANPVVYGQPLTLTATVSTVATGQGTPSGMVSFQDGGSAIGGCASQPLDPTTGLATCTTTLNAGTHTLSASYSGDGTFAASDDSASPTSLNVSQATQALTFTSMPPSPALTGGSYTVAATGGASGNPVTFSAGPSSVCTSGGTNGASISFVGAGTCVVTANQAGTPNYQAAPSVTQSITVSDPLTLGLSVTSSPPGVVTTGSTVTASFALANNTAQAQTLTLALTLRYTGRYGTFSHTTTVRFPLSAGQTVSKSSSFRVQWWFPRGTYTVSATATDGGGDKAGGSASFTVS